MNIIRNNNVHLMLTSIYTELIFSLFHTILRNSTAFSIQYFYNSSICACEDKQVFHRRTIRVELKSIHHEMVLARFLLFEHHDKRC